MCFLCFSSPHMERFCSAEHFTKTLTDSKGSGVHPDQEELLTDLLDSQGILQLVDAEVRLERMPANKSGSASRHQLELQGTRISFQPISFSTEILIQLGSGCLLRTFLDADRNDLKMHSALFQPWWILAKLCPRREFRCLPIPKSRELFYRSTAKFIFFWFLFLR